MASKYGVVDTNSQVSSNFWAGTETSRAKKARRAEMKSIVVVIRVERTIQFFLAVCE